MKAIEVSCFNCLIDSQIDFWVNNDKIAICRQVNEFPRLVNRVNQCHLKLYDVLLPIHEWIIYFYSRHLKLSRISLFSLLSDKTNADIKTSSRFRHDQRLIQSSYRKDSIQPRNVVRLLNKELPGWYWSEMNFIISRKCLKRTGSERNFVNISVLALRRTCNSNSCNLAGKTKSQDFQEISTQRLDDFPASNKINCRKNKQTHCVHILTNLRNRASLTRRRYQNNFSLTCFRYQKSFFSCFTRF